ncbi:hypothetical protein HMPREF9413_0678 [Paenibacillus sp. HGF7]|nr:hypothetical protein HMPREF9413_0678 [Paenibacillus sp. HGF7]
MAVIITIRAVQIQVTSKAQIQGAAASAGLYNDIRSIPKFRSPFREGKPAPTSRRPTNIRLVTQHLGPPKVAIEENIW